MKKFHAELKEIMNTSQHIVARMYPVELQIKFAKLTSNLHASPGKDTFVMATLRRENGTYYATPLHGKSGLMTLLTKADGYIQITSEQEGLYKDQEIEVTLLREVSR